MKKKQLYALVAFALIGSLTVGCSSNESANSGGADKNQTLSIVYQYANDDNKTGIETIINKFKEQNPNIKISEQALPLNQFYQVMQTRIGAHNYPDVVFATPAVVSDYASSGILADLTPYLPSDFFKNFTELRTSVDRPNHTIVGAPLADATRAVIYNKTAFDKAGIKAPGVNDAPWTWDQLVQAAKTLQDKKVVRYGLMFEKPSFDGWMPFLYQNGGSLLDDNGQPSINNQAGVAALDWTVKLHKDGIAAPGIIEGTDDPLRLFVSGQVGMWLSSGVWNVPALEQQVKDFQYSATYMPQNVKNTTIPGGNDLIAFKGSHEQEAAKFIQFAVSPDIISIFTNSTASFPPRSDAKNVQFARQDLVPIFTKQGQYLDPTLVAQFFSSYYGKTKDQMLRELQSAVIGQETPQQAADKMANILKQAAAK